MQRNSGNGLLGTRGAPPAAPGHPQLARPAATGLLLCILAALSACGHPPAPSPADQIAAQVAVAVAVQGTLTAMAPTSTPTPSTTATPCPTPRPSATPTRTSTRTPTPDAALVQAIGFTRELLDAEARLCNELASWLTGRCLSSFQECGDAAATSAKMREYRNAVDAIAERAQSLPFARDYEPFRTASLQRLALRWSAFAEYEQAFAHLDSVAFARAQLLYRDADRLWWAQYDALEALEAAMP